MPRYALIALIAIGGVGFILWVVVMVLAQIGEGLKSASNSVTTWRRQRAVLAAKRAIQKQLEDQRKREDALRTARENKRREEEEQISQFRRQHPAKIIGLPDFDAVKTAIALLDDFEVDANAYRPTFTLPSDMKFRDVYFSFPFEFFFPRDCGSSDGPDPEPWTTTVDSLVVPRGRDLRSIYSSVISMEAFPCKAPVLTFDQLETPRFPQIDLPRWNIKIVTADTGGEIDFRVGMLRKMYATEIAQAKNLRRTANQLLELQKRAEEAKDLMDIHIARERLAFQEAQNSLMIEFNSYKRTYEQQYETQLAPIKSICEDYNAHTKAGIEKHFQFAFRTLPLPLPSNFPWSTFYDANERLLQINQRVPFIADLVVKRSDSKRPPAKRDVDNFLRRMVPAISLRIAQHVALTELFDDVEAIAVNCWCRFFERTSGQLKNAFVSSLKVDTKDILQVNIDKADALDAFRALRGAYVYSTEETVPIEPQIRLDKKDDRFVVGKDVLEGMAQGQNLATMDWQDFEHLIRELLAKEFGRKEGSEVRITRASRDRGVDAVIFDPDPLHGGKYVVQAKRYNNLVDVSAVRDLWGTVHNEGAARGILVTTSKFGRDAYDFVSNKPLTLIDGQNLLALLAKHGYKFKIELQ